MPQNYLLPINVTVENQGSFTETFDLIVNISDTIVSTFANINLSVSESATVGFVWDNTGFEMGNYTLTAYASIVTNETETEDNTLEDWVFITILGDTNGDQQVDAKDAVAVGFAFGARPGESDWNGDADLNDDGYVNIKDVIIMGTHFGQSWP